jgi:zinc transport system ATP-binding protein
MNLHINKPLITLTNIYIGWEHRKVLSDVSLVVHEHDFIAITGPNGGGKTTLLRIMLGLLKPVRGYVKHNVADLRIGYLPQKNMIDSHFPVVVRDVIMSGLLGIKGLSTEEKNKLFDETIDAMDLAEHADRPIGLLSGGQLQRALLGRAIIAKPQLLVLDEPLSYIDKRFESRLYKIIEQLAKTTTIVLVSHEMSTIAGMANRHFIVDGNLHECSAHHRFVRTDCDE